MQYNNLLFPFLLLPRRFPLVFALVSPRTPVDVESQQDLRKIRDGVLTPTSCKEESCPASK